MKGLTDVMFDENAIETPKNKLFIKNGIRTKYINMRTSIAIHTFHMESVLWGHGSAKAQ